MIVPHISRSDKRFIFAHANRVAILDGGARQFNGPNHVPNETRTRLVAVPDAMRQRIALPHGVAHPARLCTAASGVID